MSAVNDDSLLSPCGRPMAGSSKQREQRAAERDGVDRERRSGPEAGHECAADRRACEPARDRPDELVEGVGGSEVRVGQQRRHHRLESRCEERRADAVDGDERDELPEPEHVHDREQRQHTDRDQTEDVGAEHDDAAVETVADHPGREQADDGRDGHADADDGERRR